MSKAHFEDWPFGSGDMAGRIRAHDWRPTQIGLIERWPPALRIALNMVLDHPLPMVLAWGPNLVTLYNDAYRPLLGRKPEALGRSFLDVWAEARDIIAPQIDRVLLGETIRLENASFTLTRHGFPERAFFNYTFSPVRDETGSPVGVLNTAFETTEPVLAERQGAAVQDALRQSEQRFRAFVTASSDVVYRMSPDWSEMRQLDGRGFIADTAEPSSTWLDRYIDPDDWPAVRAAIDQAIRDQALFELEHRVRRTDGSFGWTHSRAVPIADEQGEIIEWLGTARDVTRRREEQEASRANEARQAFFLELGDALRPLTDAVEIQGSACRLLAEHLSADRAYYVEIDEARGIAAVGRDYVREGSLSLVGKHPISSFSWSVDILRGGECHMVDDARTSRVVPDGARDALLALRIVSCMGTPLIKSERLVGALCITGAAPKAWSETDVVLLREVGERIWAAVERARAEASLRESEALRRIAIEGGGMGTWRWDLRDRLVWGDPRFLTLWGLPPSGDAHPLSFFVDRMSPTGMAEMGDIIARAIAAGEEFDGQLEIVAGPTAGHWVRWRGRADANNTSMLHGVSFDVTEQRRAERALNESEARLRTLVEGVPQLVWRAYDGGHWTWASPQWTAYTGQPESDSHGLGWLEPVHPDDREPVMAVWAGAIERGEFHADYRIRHAAEGRYRWFQARATPVRGEGGAVVEWLGTSTDIDDLRSLQARQDVLVAELQHRTRNLIAVVQSMANDTMEHTGPTEAFRDAFADRLSALSRVQGLLSRSEAEPITIGALLQLELDGLGAGAFGERVTVEGPEVFLKPSTVQTLALALHELGTNARKYGALSHGRGRLAVTWRERVEGGEHRLALDWHETGGEQAPEHPALPDAGGGYGRELIEHALPHVTGARTSYTITDSGARCSIDIPARPGRGGAGDGNGARESVR